LERISELATRSILLEVSCHPKPGLVTPFSQGCHKDMDYLLFLKSTAVLSQGFRSVSELGYRFDGKISDILGPIRECGIGIERRMFEVTNGINTQKGLVFLFCMLLGGAGNLMRDRIPDHSDIVKTAAAITSGIVERELGVLASKRPDELTKGERIYLEHGMTGIRGEVERGLPSVVERGLPNFEMVLKETGDLNLSALQALLALMAVVEDTNIVSRAGIDTFMEVRAMSQALLDDGGVMSSECAEGIAKMEQYFIKRNISPGGSADLLSATMFLYFVKNELF
ncbi:MAG TPA: triphosphoribosyl-dephospho-CoA synthase, partial [Candidatus Methanofastidiosa archaeon]|nr:triphosphoribosyl-dephospho-CoA synthase [Candidatus Methanofastidiosa archaeon]